jgi:hypothetical protein
MKTIEMKTIQTSSSVSAPATRRTKASPSTLTLKLWFVMPPPSGSSRIGPDPRRYLLGGHGGDPKSAAPAKPPRPLLVGAAKSAP